jgi:hypothetical protein
LVPPVGPFAALTTGEINAHLAEIYGASVSKETISRITDKVLEEMTDWADRPLESTSGSTTRKVRTCNSASSMTGDG